MSVVCKLVVYALFHSTALTPTPASYHVPVYMAFCFSGLFSLHNGNVVLGIFDEEAKKVPGCQQGLDPNKFSFSFPTESLSPPST